MMALPVRVEENKAMEKFPNVLRQRKEFLPWLAFVFQLYVLPFLQASLLQQLKQCNMFKRKWGALVSKAHVN